MINNFGENLKCLRRNKDLTQDEVAKILNVSTQTISRWETNMGYPDIELLPSIANFYNVTIDSLLGLDNLKKKERINEIISSQSIYKTNGERKKCIEICREGLREFPNDYRLLNELASALFNYGDTDQEFKNNNQEVIEICESLLKECLEDDIRHHAIQLLCYTYPQINKKEKALELAKSMPSYYMTSNELMRNCIDENDIIKHTQDNLYSLIQIIPRNIWPLVIYTKDSGEKIRILKSLIRVFEGFYDNGDYYFVHCILHKANRYIAAIYAVDKNINETLEYLQIATNHAIAYDNRPNKHTFTSSFFKDYNDEVLYSVRNSTKNESWVLLDNLQDENYDFLRNDIRFIDIISSLKQFAKE